MAAPLSPSLDLLRSFWSYTEATKEYEFGNTRLMRCMGCGVYKAGDLGEMDGWAEAHFAQCPLLPLSTGSCVSIAAMPFLKPRRLLHSTFLAVCLLFVMPACRTPSSSGSQDTLAQAIIAAHKAAAPAARQMVANAKAAIDTKSRSLVSPTPEAAAELATAKAEVANMEAAVSKYEGLVSTENWQERLVPLLREALVGYQRMIQLGVQLGFTLPPVPPVVLDLLQPCGAT